MYAFSVATRITAQRGEQINERKYWRNANFPRPINSRIPSYGRFFLERGRSSNLSVGIRDSIYLCQSFSHTYIVLLRCVAGGRGFVIISRRLSPWYAIE